ALGVGIAYLPGQVAYWLPNMWFACAAGWVVLSISPLMRLLRRWKARVPAIVLLGLGALAAAQALLPIGQPWSSVVGWALLLVGAMLIVGRLPALESSAALR